MGCSIRHTVNMNTDQITPIQLSYFDHQLGFWTRERTFNSRRYLLGAIEFHDRVGSNYRIIRNGCEITLDEALAR